ncbi:quinon protein alcohol dehydrogenase-like superfamily [Powellomyces hirtus]|nr:quinon protein alcohol dehydrogenase-like superfamily [Powellomyces hirtus]
MLAEIAVTASSTDNLVHIWDLRSGAVLGSLKGNKSNQRCTTLLPVGGAGGSLYSSSFLTAQNDRALVHVWNWAKGQLQVKFGLPEKLSSLCASHSGMYCVGGGQSGRVYVWQMNTGKLLRMFDAHYKAVRVIRFTADDAAFVTGGEDSVANVWRLAEVIDPQLDNVVSPHCSLSGHALPITDIACGIGLFGNTRIVTSSADRTCKIWEASSGDLLNTIVFPKSISSLALDPTETRLYSGSSDGLIYCTNLYHQSSDGQTHGMSQGVDAGETDPGVFTGHTQNVTSLCFSFDGSLLLSGSEDGTAIVWDAASKQSLRSFTTHKAPVSSVNVLLKPPHLMDAGAASSGPYATHIRPWQRHSTAGTDDMMQQQTVEDFSWRMPATSGVSSDIALERTTVHPSSLSTPSSTSAFLFSVDQQVRQIHRAAAQDNNSNNSSQSSQFEDTAATLAQCNSKVLEANNGLYQAAVTQLIRDVKQDHD